jgi:hypothetical protein
MIRLWKLLLSAQDSPGGVPAEVSASSIPLSTLKLIVESIDGGITVYRSEKGGIVGSERSRAGHAGEDDGSRSFSGSFWRCTTGESSAHSLSKWGRTNGLSSTLLYNATGHPDSRWILGRSITGSTARRWGQVRGSGSRTKGQGWQGFPQRTGRRGVWWTGRQGSI